MKIALIFLCVIVLPGCNNKQTKRTIDYYSFIESESLVAKQRIQNFKFTGWQPLSKKFLIINSWQQKSYLIELRAACQDLPYANNIILKQDMERVLRTFSDKVDVPGQIGPACRIETIYVLNKEQHKSLLDFAQKGQQSKVIRSKWDHRKDNQKL